MRMRDFYRFQILHTEGSPIDPSGGTERGDIRVDWKTYSQFVYMTFLGYNLIYKKEDHDGLGGTVFFQLQESLFHSPP